MYVLCTDISLNEVTTSFALQKNGTFRVSAVKFFLTWPKCPLSKETVKELLWEIKAPKFYIICEETHLDGSPHIHAYVEFNKRVETRNSSYFNLNSYQCNIGRVRHKWRAINYCKKDGNFITNIKKINKKYKNLNLVNNAKYVTVVELARNGQIQEAFDELIKINSKIVINNGIRIMKNLEFIYNNEQKKKKKKNAVPPPPKPCYDFDEQKELMTYREDFMFKKSLWLSGPTSWGKTEYAKSLFKNPLVVTHLDDLKKLTDNYDGIVFDDMDFRGMPSSLVLHITDVINGGSINVKYSHVSIPPGVPRVFTSNTPIFDDDKVNYLHRRVFFVMLEQTLIPVQDIADEFDQQARHPSHVPTEQEFLMKMNNL